MYVNENMHKIFRLGNCSGPIFNIIYFATVRVERIALSLMPRPAVTLRGQSNQNRLRRPYTHSNLKHGHLFGLFCAGLRSPPRHTRVWLRRRPCPTQKILENLFHVLNRNEY